MDFTTPWDKFTLSMLGGLAELYSDNLSLETKKAGMNTGNKVCIAKHYLSEL